MNRLVIIGASGHGKVVADIAVKNGYKNICFLDDDDSIKECAGFPVIGKTNIAFEINDDKIVAIGNSAIRRRIQERLNNVVTLIHPKAIISRRVKIGVGTVVMAGAVINSDTTIGDGCIINTASSVDHDCSIGDFVHVSIGAHVAGICKIGNDTWIGAGATVSNCISICDNCMIGAGAVVVGSIKKRGVYIGVPAMEKQDKKNIIGGGQ